VKIEARYIVAAILLVFAWKGNTLDLSWPPVGEFVAVVEPSADQMKWATDLRVIAPRILPGERVYLSGLYEAMRSIVERDGKRDAPIINTTEAFARFQSGTLELAIDLDKVGKYPGLDVAIDKVFFEAIGTDEPRSLTAVERQKIMDACAVLSYTFGIGRDG
jgi:hypothetical protein